MAHDTAQILLERRVVWGAHIKGKLLGHTREAVAPIGGTAGAQGIAHIHRNCQARPGQRLARERIVDHAAQDVGAQGRVEGNRQRVALGDLWLSLKRQSHRLVVRCSDSQGVRLAPSRCRKDTVSISGERCPTNLHTSRADRRTRIGVLHRTSEDRIVGSTGGQNSGEQQYEKGGTRPPERERGQIHAVQSEHRPFPREISYVPVADSAGMIKFLQHVVKPFGFSIAYESHVSGDLCPTANVPSTSSSNPLGVVAWSRGFSRIRPPKGLTPFHNELRDCYSALLCQKTKYGG